MLDNNNDLLVDLFTNDIVSSICFNSIQTKRPLPPIHFSSNLSNEMVDNDFICRGVVVHCYFVALIVLCMM